MKFIKKLSLISLLCSFQQTYAQSETYYINPFTQKDIVVSNFEVDEECEISFFIEGDYSFNVEIQTIKPQIDTSKTVVYGNGDVGVCKNQADSKIICEYFFKNREGLPPIQDQQMNVATPFVAKAAPIVFSPVTTQPHLTSASVCRDMVLNAGSMLADFSTMIQGCDPDGILIVQGKQHHPVKKCLKP